MKSTYTLTLSPEELLTLYVALRAHEQSLTERPNARASTTLREVATLLAKAEAAL